jgi:hypothetical protein
MLAEHRCYVGLRLRSLEPLTPLESSVPPGSGRYDFPLDSARPKVLREVVPD